MNIEEISKKKIKEKHQNFLRREIWSHRSGQKDVFHFECVENICTQLHNKITDLIDWGFVLWHCH